MHDNNGRPLRESRALRPRIPLNRHQQDSHRVFCRCVGRGRKHIHAVLQVRVYQDAPWGACCAVSSALLRRGHSLYHASCTSSRHFTTGWFPQSLVKPSNARDPAADYFYSYKVAIFDSRQSHICRVAFGIGQTTPYHNSSWPASACKASL